MAHLDMTFPTGLSFKSTGGETFNTTVIVTSGGQEYRNGNWVAPRRKYVVTVMTPAHADAPGTTENRAQFIANLRALFVAAQGKLNSFNFVDPLTQEVVPVRFDTDEFNIQIEESDVADGRPIISWNNVVLLEVRAPNY